MIAEPGDTLKGQYQKLARLTRRPDAIILYCGHNEFASGIPWSRKVDHYLDEKPPPVGRLTAVAGRLSPVCSLIQQTADKFRVGVSPPRTFRHQLVEAPAY